MRTFGRTGFVSALVAALVVTVAPKASATSISFNFATTAINPVTNLANPVSYPSSPAGITATASGFGLPSGAAGATFSTAYLNSFASPTAYAGLGVCNTFTDASGGDGGTAHCTTAGSPGEPFIDNVTTPDYLLLTFSNPINIDSISIIGPAGVDRDLIYYLGTNSAPILVGKTLAQLAGQGFGAGVLVNNTSSTTSVDINGKWVSSILIGASMTQTSDNPGGVDRFRVTGLTGSTVPEPASMVLLGSGLVGIASRMRNRKRNASREL